jgi:hypothetical protein
MRQKACKPMQDDAVTSDNSGTPDVNFRPDDELQILLSDYVSLRDDERSTIATQGVAVSIAIALLGGLVAFASQSCTLAADHKSCVDVPTAFLATAPAVPFAALGFIILQGVVSVIRSYYMRVIEMEIQARTPMKFKHLSKLGSPSFIGLTTEILSLRRGRWSYRALVALIVFVGTLTFTGITFYIAIHLDATTRNLMLFLYSVGILLVGYECYIMAVRGRQLFLDLVDDYNIHKDNLLLFAKSRQGRQRAIFSYLFLPRLESIPKSALSVIMFSVAASATDEWQWRRFLLLWLILEYFAYAARYQWNDLRDFDTDQLHPARTLRGRLPAGDGARDTTHNIVLSTTVLLLRLGLAVFIGIETQTLAQVGLIMGTVFGVAICYEILRARISNRKSSVNNSGIASAVLVWLAVGLGYAVRGAVGLLAAHVRWTDPALYIGLAGLMALGIMVVLMSWLLDATSFFSVAPDGTWHIKEDSSVAKPYAWVLLRYAPVPMQGKNSPEEATFTQGVETEGQQERLLNNGRAGWAPWNIAYVSASILICEFAISLPSGRVAPGASYYLTAVVCIAGALLMIYSNQQWKRWLVTISFSGFILLASQGVDFAHWLLTAIGWLAVGACYTSFCGMSFLDLVQALPRFWDRFIKSGFAVIEIALGATTFQYLLPQSRPVGTDSRKPGESDSSNLDLARIGGYSGALGGAGVPSVLGPCLADEPTDGDDGVGEVEERVDDRFAALVAALEAV